MVGKAWWRRTRRTQKWLKVKVPTYREGERGWDPKK